MRRTRAQTRPNPLLPMERYHTTLTTEIDGVTYAVRAWIADYGLDFQVSPDVSTDSATYDAIERVARRAVIATADAAEARRSA